MHRFPDLVNAMDVEWLGNLLGVCMFLAFAVFIINTVSHIVMEKERKLNEVLKIVGVSSYLYWGSWGARTTIYLILSTSLVVGMMKVNFDFVEKSSKNSNETTFHQYFISDKSLCKCSLNMGVLFRLHNFNDDVLLCA